MLCSFALSNHSVLMAWANRSLSPKAAIAQIQGFEDAYPNQSPENAWSIAVVAAEASDAEFMFRARTQ